MEQITVSQRKIKLIKFWFTLYHCIYFVSFIVSTILGEYFQSVPRTIIIVSPLHVGSGNCCGFESVGGRFRTSPIRWQKTALNAVNDDGGRRLWQQRIWDECCWNCALRLLVPCRWPINASSAWRKNRTRYTGWSKKAEPRFQFWDNFLT